MDPNKMPVRVLIPIRVLAYPLPVMGISAFWYQSKTISGPKNVSYDAQLCPIIVKSPSAPSAEATHQIANRHFEEVKSSCTDSQTLKNLF